MTTDEQNITYALSCVSTHTPEEMLHLIINLEWEDVTNIDKVVFHPTFPKELYETMDRIATKRLDPTCEERKRVQEERKRVQEEIERADELIYDLRQKTEAMRKFNDMMEGQLGMYQQLNAQMN